METGGKAWKEMAMVVDDDGMDNEEIIQKIRDYLVLFDRKCARMRGRELMEDGTLELYEDYESLRDLLNPSYRSVNGISVVDGGDMEDPHTYTIHMTGLEGTVRLTFFQMKVECPHMVAFYVNYYFPEWTLENELWRWCADRRMVPLGDH